MFISNLPFQKYCLENCSFLLTKVDRHRIRSVLPDFCRMSRGLILRCMTAVEKTERRPSDKNLVQTVLYLHSDPAGRGLDSSPEGVGFLRTVGSSQKRRNRSAEGCRRSRPSAAAERSALGRESKRNSDWGPVSAGWSRGLPLRPQKDRCFRGQSRSEIVERRMAEKVPAGS